VVIKMLTEGGTFRSIKGIDERSMEAIYSLGYTYYNNSKYDDAHDIFRFLCLNDHLVRKYWMALGACRQMMKNFEGAVQAYAYASVLDVEDPRAPLQAADCFLAMEKFEEAESALNGAIHFSEGKPEFADVRSKAQAVLELLKNRDASKGGK
jgi:type III secretion system low calcium response chaperone LcrH/SycD